MKKLILAVLAIVLISACTSVKVQSVGSDHKISHLCIENNEQVIVHDFVPTIVNRIKLKGISSQVYSGELPEGCRYRMTYTALRSWDFTPYLSHAEVNLYEGYTRIGQAEYHLKGKGGLSLAKWASVASKMNPVIDQLFANQ